MTTIDLDALEATARAATPGPWLIGNSEMYGPSAITRDAEGLPQVQDQWVCDADAGHPNAEHIATFDPPTVLALIARLRESEAVIENTSHIHGPRKVWESDRAYTLVCTVCITEPYPCATVLTLSRHKPTNQENGEET